MRSDFYLDTAVEQVEVVQKNQYASSSRGKAPEHPQRLVGNIGLYPSNRSLPIIVHRI